MGGLLKYKADLLARNIEDYSGGNEADEGISEKE